MSSLVDTDAYREAISKWAGSCMGMLQFTEAYEQAKLDKADHIPDVGKKVEPYSIYLPTTGNPRIDAERHADKLFKYHCQMLDKAVVKKSFTTEPLPEITPVDYYPEHEMDNAVFLDLAALRSRINKLFAFCEALKQRMEG